MASNSSIPDPNGDLDDWIELHNPTDQPVDVGGWHLTDDLSTPHKWQFPLDRPDLTTVAPQGFLIVWADNDVNQGPLHSTFRLSQSGEQIGLFSPDGTAVYTLTYPAQKANVSWALDDVLNQWYAAPYPTPGQPNAQTTAKVIFSEIMYNPSVEDERPEDPNMEFIELLNAGDALADLSGWALTRGVSYVFPEQTYLEPGQSLVVALSPDTIEQQYGLSQVHGPWLGGLSNDGETLALEDATGSVVNRIRYADAGDWAQRTLGPNDRNHRGWFWKADHDGHGRSLELVNPRQDNTYGHNWRASEIEDGTPGQENSVMDVTSVPLIKKVRQSPALPTSTDEVRVTATIDFGQPLAGDVTLHYRIDESQYEDEDIYPQYDANTYVTVLMRDAGDHKFQGSIPAQASGTIVEFFVRAENAQSHSQTWPAAAMVDDTLQQVANALYQVEDEWDHLSPDTLENQPVYYVIMTNMERARLDDIGDGEGGEHNSDAQVNATFISALGTNVDLRYNTGIRNRGHGSRRHNPNNMRINFRSDEPWQSVTAININAQYGYRQVIGSALCQLAHLPVAKAKLVQVRVNGQNRASSGSRMYGSYAHVEVINSEFADRQFPNDDNGNLYKCYRDNSPTANLIYRGDTPTIYRRNYFKKSNESKDDWTDLYDLTFKLSESPDDTYLQDVQSRVNIDAWLKFLAVNILLGNTETSLSNGRGDDYYLYSGVNDPRFYLVPHDLDSIFQDNNTDPLRFWSLDSLARLVGHPAVASQYYGYLSEYMDTLLSPANLQQVFDRLSLDGVPNGALQGMINYANNRYARMRPQIEASFTVETTLPLEGLVYQADQASVVLFGDADPVPTGSVMVNGHQAQWDPLNASWSMSQWNDPTTLVAKRSNWRYFDQYTDLGPDWYLNIDDSTWAEGPAELGYGDGGEATVVGSVDAEPDTPGTQRNLTTYFTRTFDVVDPAEFTHLSLQILRDDGAIVYLNGVEIARSNMPDGAVDYYTPARRATSDESRWRGDGSDGDDFTRIDAGLLVAGSNRLAVEIHQASYSSSDISFDLELVGLSQAQGLLTLQPGLNRITAKAYSGPNGSGQILDSIWIDIAYQWQTTTNLAGVLTEDTHLAAAAGPYRVTDRLTVPDGVTLTIEAGTTLFFGPSAGITVSSGGCIQALGTEALPIRWTRIPGLNMNWQGLLLDHTRQDNRLCYVDFEYGDEQGESIAVEYATILLDHVTFGGTAKTVLELHHPDAMVQHCVFPSVATEPVHGTGLSGDDSLVFDSCTFGSALGYSDIIDFAGGARPGPILQCYNCVFLGGPDDGLDLDGTDAHIQGNLFMNFHKDNNSDGDSSAVATGQGGGHSSQINLAQNIFLNNDYGVLLKEDCALVSQNNSFVNTTKAVITFGEPYRNPPRTPGYGAALTNDLFWNNAAMFEHYFADPNPDYGPAVLTADHCLMPFAWHGLGTGNFEADPMLLPDGSLDSLSPARGAGVGGSNLGVLDAAALTFSGVPFESTWRTTATVWVSGPGITHYVYSLNEPNGPYSEERSVADPIVLDGLNSGELYRLYAQGKNSAGLWQDMPTGSGAWQVQAGHVTLRLNEVLVTGESIPAFVELYYDGPASLSGHRVSLSQDPNVPGQLILGTDLAPDTLIEVPLDNRLPLNASGDNLVLFLDDAVQDKIEFGAQIPDLAVGQWQPGGPWRVTDPTPGQANRPASTGNPRDVTINEWLAFPDATHNADFIELHNPSDGVVDVGGFFLTDNPLGEPAMHALPPSTLIAAHGTLVLTANESTGPAHVSFKLSAEGEILSLRDPDLTEIDTILFGPQAQGISQGRSPDSSDQFVWFDEPSPGQANYSEGPTVPTETKNLIPYEYAWSYNQDNQPLDSDWITQTYDDSSWPSGPGLLYVEGSALPATKNTPLTLGARTYYFRTEFTLDQDPSKVASLDLYTILDDGAIIYLNGQEILRIGVPEGAITHDTFANNTVGNASIEGPFELDPAALRPGLNTLAAEVHQTSANSSDIVFGLQLDTTTYKE